MEDFSFFKPLWNSLVDEMLLEIFKNVSASDILRAQQVCLNWSRVAADECLWKITFCKDFNVSLDATLPSGAVSWKSEYKRLFCEVPAVESEVITGHTDEVLHASFSHIGYLFATSSKDGTFRVYDCATLPSRLLGQSGTDEHGLEHVMFTAFSPDDKLLLVSGSKHDSCNGFIAIYSLLCLPHKLPMLARVANRMYDVFGAWFDARLFLSGITNKVHRETFRSTAILNKLQMESEEQAAVCWSPLYNFVFKNYNVMRYLSVVDDPCPNSHLLQSENMFGDEKQSFEFPEFLATADYPMKLSLTVEGPGDKLLYFSCGHVIQFGHQIGFKRFSSRHKHSTAKISVAGKQYDEKDKVIELNGQVIGLKAAPDQRTLFVNVRKWPCKDDHSAIPKQPVELSTDVEMVVIDLETLESKGTQYMGHKGFSQYDGCFIIFPDVSDDFVASGSEDFCGVIWDRHYRCLLQRLPHKDVVNCTAFCPSDQQTMVTVSDDCNIKVWRSRQRMHTFKGLPCAQ